MKDTSLTPVLAGITLALTFAMAAVGAIDASLPSPEAAAELAKDQGRPQMVAEWTGLAIP